MKQTISIILLACIFFSCNQADQAQIDVQDIVDRAIEVSGKSKLKYADLNYTFRDFQYTSSGKCNHFVYTRSLNKNDFTLTDVYNTNKELKRFINEEETELADSTAFKYAESINSVNYFIQLPLPLNDQAVIKSYQGLDTIKGKSYYTVKVQFDQKNGGTDFEDIYYYWFGENDFKLDYLAYSFTVNGGGIRFREAYNERIINGIRFVDYKNYKPIDDQTTLEHISEKFNNGELELLSKIENNIISLEESEIKC